jgi:2-oxopent-4-enoate hydratase
MTGRLDDQAVARLGLDLWTAWRTRKPIPPLTDAYPDMTPAEAYAVQQVVAARRQDDGETIVGWKMGLTSAAMQRQLGVDQPDYGPLLSGHLVEDDATVSMDELIQPRVEAEIAFLLDEPLRGPGITIDDVLRATRGVAAALEVIDSRVERWQIRLADTIADLASCARIVAATDRLVPPDEIDFPGLGVVVERNGEPVGEGSGAAVLGHPAEAVAWAANTLGPLGVTLEAGQLIMPGAMHASIPAVRGDRFEARFDRLGSVRVRFD